MEYIRLNDGNMIPDTGFGTYKMGDEGHKIITEAVEAGYRLFDTAKVYENEETVGKALKDSGLSRDELYITSKLDRNMLGKDSARIELEKTLNRLGTDYLDLYLLHWPRADYGNPDFDRWKELDIESWKTLEQMKKEGLVKSIGVSNFLPHHLNNLIENTDTVPAVNQLELHPGYMQAEACRYCREKGIVLEAWSPVGRGRLAVEPLMVSLAEKYGTSIPHLCLVYLYQEGIIPLPKSSSPERMRENMILDDISIEEDDMWRIRTMPQAGWGGEHPDFERRYF